MAELTVFIHLPREIEAVPAGRLELVEAGVEVRGSRFAYGTRYLRRGNALPGDPGALALRLARPGADLGPRAGLLRVGALRDATPDLWGRGVIDSRLRAPPNGLPESVYLREAGPHRAGALDIRDYPTSPANKGSLPALMDLQHLLDAAARVEEGLPVLDHLELFVDGGPASGGARAKAAI